MKHISEKLNIKITTRQAYSPLQILSIKLTSRKKKKKFCFRNNEHEYDIYVDEEWFGYFWVNKVMGNQHPLSTLKGKKNLWGIEESWEDIALSFTSV